MRTASLWLFAVRRRQEAVLTLNHASLLQKAPAKSILHNKGETPLVSREPVVVVETNLIAPVKKVPKDAVEIKHDKAKKVKVAVVCI